MRKGKRKSKPTKSKSTSSASRSETPTKLSQLLIGKVIKNKEYKSLQESKIILSKPIRGRQSAENTKSKVSCSRISVSRKMVTETASRKSTRSTVKKNAEKTEIKINNKGTTNPGLPVLIDFVEEKKHESVTFENYQNFQLKNLVVRLPKIILNENCAGEVKLKSATKEKKDMKSVLIVEESEKESSDFFSRNEMEIIISESEITYDNMYSANNCSIEVYGDSKCQKNEKKFFTLDKYLSAKEKKPPGEITKFSECSSLSYHDDHSVFIELNDVSLEDLKPAFDCFLDGEMEIKLEERLTEKKTNVKNYLINLQETINESSDHSNSPRNSSNHEQDICQISTINNVSLQSMIDSFMNTSQVKFSNEVNSLKTGLCSNWLKNNYKCDLQNCMYFHNAFKLFTNKLKNYPSNFIVILVASMRNDDLFVDMLTAALKVLKFRRFSETWIKVLTFFVFYVTEPADVRFLTFWCDTARFFFDLNEEYTAANGFAKLLSIFSESRTSEEWKIIEFVKLVKKPPIQIPITYALLNPIIKMDLPVEFLIEAVDSSLKIKDDVVDVYKNIIPKICVMNLPVPEVELLLRFCETLYEMNQNSYADDLKLKLFLKVQTLKIKILEHDYPLVASCQNEIDINKKRNLSITCFDDSVPGDGFKTNLWEQEYNCFGDTTYDKKTFNNNLPSLLEGTSVLLNTKNDIRKREKHIQKIQQLFSCNQFSVLGQYLNSLRQDVILSVAEEVIKLLFQMKVSLEEVVDLFKTLVSSCKTESAGTVIASLGVTLILNFVKINQWDKAYTLFSLCHDKHLNLVNGMVFVSKEFNSISQLRIALLLVEVNTYKENYEIAILLIKKYNLFSSDSSKWGLFWKSGDENVRVRILEQFFSELVFRQVTDVAYDLFLSIWKEQSHFHAPVDLRIFSNQIMILLLNQDDREALRLFEEIKGEVYLDSIVIRGILVTLVRHKYYTSAKSLLLRIPSIYTPPNVASSSIVLTLSSFWLEEEIYLVFDSFFDKLISSYLVNDIFSEGETNFEVLINVVKENIIASSTFLPICLSLIEPTFEQTCIRVRRVLYQFFPPIMLNITSKILKIDPNSLKLYISKRINHIKVTK